ncbi:hypothetical protein EfmAA96_20570 [Enterococcus faecium]|nr:hypothetical protein EfmAA96_20570 [Enterococcus faecium]
MIKVISSIVVNVLTALYQPFGFSVSLSILAMYFYLFATAISLYFFFAFYNRTFNRVVL